MTFLYWQPVLIVALINVTIVSGLCINAMSGILSMATAAIAGIGGYAAAILTTNFGWPLAPALLASLLCGGIVGGVMAALTLKMRDFVLKLTTLAFGEAVTVIAYNIDYLGGANGFSGIPLATNLFVALVVAALALYVLWRFGHSRIGMAARAVRDDPAAAEATGISVAQTRVTSFALGAAIVGVGGGVQAHYLTLVGPQDMGFYSSFVYIIFLVVGGSYSMAGPLVATVVLTLAPELLRFAGQFRLIIFGALVLAIVLFRPRGIMSRSPTGCTSPIDSTARICLGLIEHMLPQRLRAVVKRSKAPALGRNEKA